MARATNWDKINRDRRLSYIPSPRVQSPTQRQLDYIDHLAHKKGQQAPKPKTKKGASDHIDRLLALPDRDQTVPVANTELAQPEPSARKELVIELRSHFARLTPMTADSLAQLFDQIDSAGTAFILDGLYREEAPEDPAELILWLLRRFLDQLEPWPSVYEPRAKTVAAHDKGSQPADITPDDTLVTG